MGEEVCWWTVMGVFDPREGVALGVGLAVQEERAGWRKLVSMGMVSLGESAGCGDLEGVVRWGY